MPLGETEPQRQEVGLLKPRPCGPIDCFGTKWYSDRAGARSTRDGDHQPAEDDSSFNMVVLRT